MQKIDKKRLQRGASAHGVFEESKQSAQAIIDRRLIMLRQKTEALKAMRLARSPLNSAGIARSHPLAGMHSAERRADAVEAVDRS